MVVLNGPLSIRISPFCVQTFSSHPICCDRLSLAQAAEEATGVASVVATVAIPCRSLYRTSCIVTAGPLLLGLLAVFSVHFATFLPEVGALSGSCCRVHVFLELFLCSRVVHINATSTVICCYCTPIAGANGIVIVVIISISEKPARVLL